MPFVRDRLAILLISLAFLLPAPAWAGEKLSFNLPVAGGGRLNLAKFRGRVVVLDFFATYCRPCKESWPKLNRMVRHFDNRGLSVIAYSVDRAKDRKKVLPYAVRHLMNFPVVLGSAAQARRLADVSKLPTTVVLDRRGRVAHRFEGLVSEQTLLAAIYPHLSRHAPPAPEQAQVNRRRPEDRRIKKVWITPAEKKNRRLGFYVHVNAEVVDLALEQGLWLGLFFQPEVKTASGLTPIGKAKPLYMLIKKASQDYFVLFVNYRQLPPVPKDGLHRLWVVLLGPGLKPLEKSGELVFDFHLEQLQNLQ